VKKGGDRQKLHEKLRVHSIAAAKKVKEEGLANDLIDRVCADSDFMLEKSEIDAILKPINFVGRSVEQVDEYLTEIIKPMLIANKNILGESAELLV
ncbi:MAG: adenylosuccinate lyase, partial [Hydrogenoanaerobacterium sp.]